MSYARQMLDACPRALNVDTGLLAATLEALNDCTQACVTDSDCDLGEQNVIEMVTCIRLCLDCADVCTATAAVLSRQAEYDLKVTEPLLGFARWYVRAAATSANGMPGCMSTAGCAPRPAAVASKPAGSCWTRSNRKLGGIRIAGQDAVS